MKRQVQWSAKARDDLDSQIAYIAADNPNAARRVAERIFQAAKALGDIPTGRRGRVSGTYEKLARSLPFLIVYALDDRVTILRIVHTARDWPDDDWPD